MLKNLITIFCILTTSLLVGSHPAPGQWSLIGQYLYLQPSVDDSYFVIESFQNDFPDDNVSPILIGNERNNQFNFASAYRVGIEYGFCECDREFGIYYTNLDTNHRKTISENFLTPVIGIEDFTTSMFEYLGRASSRASIHYKSLDLLAGQKIYQCCGLDFRVLCGIEFAKLNFHQRVDYLPSVGQASYSSFVNQKASTQGVGPKIGLEFDYELPKIFCCFPGELSLNFFSTGSLLTSRCKARTQIDYESNGGTFFPYNIALKKSNRVIPAFHIGSGLNYRFCSSCYVFDIGIGYEFSTYLKSLLTMKNIAYYGGGLTETKFSDFDAQGLYVSLSLQF